MVPPSTITTRFALATAAAFLGVATFVGNLWYAAAGIDAGIALTACLLGVMTCTLCAVTGTFLRPLD